MRGSLCPAPAAARDAAAGRVLGVAPVAAPPQVAYQEWAAERLVKHDAWMLAIELVWHVLMTAVVASSRGIGHTILNDRVIWSSCSLLLLCVPTALSLLGARRHLRHRGTLLAAATIASCVLGVVRASQRSTSSIAMWRALCTSKIRRPAMAVVPGFLFQPLQLRLTLAQQVLVGVGNLGLVALTYQCTGSAQLGAATVVLAMLASMAVAGSLDFSMRGAWLSVHQPATVDRRGRAGASPAGGRSRDVRLVWQPSPGLA